MNIHWNHNREYYTSEESKPCSCNACLNYTRLLKEAYPKICAYLESMGIDALRPFELCPSEPDENSVLEYCVCQYIVFGSCEKDFSHRINDVVFRVSTSHPETGIREEHFVLEFYPIYLPMQCP